MIFAQFLVAPAARQFLGNFFSCLRRGCLYYRDVAFFFGDAARIVAALYYSDFGSIFCRACGAAKIFKAICSAAYTFVILALFLLASYGSPCDGPLLLCVFLNFFFTPAAR